MWSALTEGREFDAAWSVLVVEACRIADRLDKLDELLRGDTDVWARIEDDYTGSGKVIKLVFDDALAEARQQANALRQIVTSLKLGVASAAKPEGRSVLDDLASRRSSRRSASAS